MLSGDTVTLAYSYVWC